MIPHRTVDQHRIARAHPRRGKVHARSNHTDTRRVDENAISGAMLHDLGITGDDLHARNPRRVCH